MTSITEATRMLCLALPESEEIISHGSPTYKAAGKSFAIFSLNHHGDGKVALLLNTSIDTQQMLVSSAPAIFFIPPYVGPKGWVGVELNQGLAWKRVSQLVQEAYIRTVPARLANLSSQPTTAAPDEPMAPADINPLLSVKNQQLAKKIHALCTKFPEVKEDAQFGNPCFRAGKKTFALLGCNGKDPYLQIWVGSDRQLSLTSFDDRFVIPAYSGKNGWINLDLGQKQNWLEIGALLLESYRHFALKRMLAKLEQP